MEERSEFELSQEQLYFIYMAKAGKNILVDACIGSGKTTSIQKLCDELPPSRKILYLTYNKLLKKDAQEKIKNENVLVTNYHGFAYQVLNRLLKQNVPRDSLIQRFNSTFDNIKNNIEKYDLIIIDEYQDIQTDYAIMLNHLKDHIKNVQLIAVGDMAQRIYNTTSLDVKNFIKGFLGEYENVEFTKCFRLSARLADRLSNIWCKPIEGVNQDCKVSTMTEDEVVEVLKDVEPKDLLCLGPAVKWSTLTSILNKIERLYPYKFNKKTIYASIRNSLDEVSTKENIGIFTTFDRSKGMERDICILCDFTERYWTERMSKPNTDYETLKNIFCVAASRGKKHIIFVTSNKSELLSDKTLRTNPNEERRQKDVNISTMFNYTFSEDIKACEDILNIRNLNFTDKSVISITPRDCLIDLSPCIGMYQEIEYFRNNTADSYCGHDLQKNIQSKIANKDLQEYLLYYMAYTTGQWRYVNQIKRRYISDTNRERIINRLNSIFNGDEETQIDCRINYGKFMATGRADVIKDGILYELKFVGELQPTYYLQLACYMYALNINKGILWNIKDNSAFEVQITDKEKFLLYTYRTITKQGVNSDSMVLSDPNINNQEAKEEPEAEGHRGRFRFSMIAMEPGDKVYLLRDKTKVAVGYDDISVRYDGEVLSLTALARKLLGVKSKHGPEYFTYSLNSNESLAELRDILTKTDT